MSSYFDKFSPLQHPALGKDMEINQNNLIIKYLALWLVLSPELFFFFFLNQMTYMTADLRIPNGIHLSQSLSCGKASWAHWEGFKLDLKGRGEWDSESSHVKV